MQDWEEFERELKRLEEEHDQRKSSQHPPPYSPLLFRGQENSCWQLETTLERNGNTDFGFSEYFQVCHRAKREIESFTGVDWNVPEYPEARKLLTLDPMVLSPKCRKRWLGMFRYLVYLRHFGFPSPLLDWTSSPYIAAYFAFRRLIKDVNSLSIYVYCKAPGGFPTNTPITALGPPVGTHRRHFLQKCWYTICAVEKENGLHLASHEDVVARGDPEQDVIRKFNIPSAERLKVLSLLENYNLNAFSLFGSEESLMETMATRELEFKENYS